MGLGTEQDHQSSMGHTVRVRGVREKGKGRDGDREPAEDSIYLACSKGDRAKTEKKHQRVRERDLCEWGGDLCEIDMDDECV